MDLLSEIVNW